jgi:hypothetical protein
LINGSGWGLGFNATERIFDGKKSRFTCFLPFVDRLKVRVLDDKRIRVLFVSPNNALINQIWLAIVIYISYAVGYILQHQVFSLKQDREAGVFKKNERCKMPTALLMY